MYASRMILLLCVSSLLPADTAAALDTESGKRRIVSVQYGDSGLCYIEGREHDVQRFREVSKRIRDELIIVLKDRKDVRIYEIMHGDVRSAAEMLQTLFSTDRHANVLVRMLASRNEQTRRRIEPKSRSENSNGSPPDGSTAGSLLSALESQTHHIRVFADVQGRRLVVNASPEDQDSIAELLRRFDKPRSKGVNLRVIKLDRVSSREAERVLDRLLEMRSQTHRPRVN